MITSTILKKITIFAEKNMQMSFSVITINYNNSLGLKQTIESVTCQTNKDFEFIIIDGGSTDGSVDVIKEYENQITYWVSEKDYGIYNAINKGIVKAHGNYSIFMNSGDIFYDNNVLEKIAAINRDPDIIVGKVSKDNSDTIISPPPNGNFTMYHLYSGANPHQGSFIRTALLQKYPYDENLKISADWKFFVQTLFLENCSIYYTNEHIAKYDTSGISSSNPQLMRKEKEEYLKTIFPPRVLADYRKMKDSECLTQSLTPLLRKNYKIDHILSTIN